MSEIASMDRELQALLSLLETEREESVGILLEQIRSFPDSRMDRLIEMSSPASGARSQLDVIAAQRAVPRLQAELLEWKAGRAALEDGVLLVARIGYPQLDGTMVRKQLDEIAGAIRPGLPRHSVHERLGHVVRIMNDVYDFHGNQDDYYDPENSYLNRVLERRTGLPISLSVVYMLLGTRLGLDITGVALPGHFLACLREESDAIYFDAFRRGTMLTLREVMGIVTAGGHPFQPSHLRAPTAVDIVKRMLNNLELAYAHREDDEREDIAHQYLAVLSE